MVLRFLISKFRFNMICAKHRLKAAAKIQSSLLCAIFSARQFVRLIRQFVSFMPKYLAKRCQREFLQGHDRKNAEGIPQEFVVNNYQLFSYQLSLVFQLNN